MSNWSKWATDKRNNTGDILRKIRSIRGFSLDELSTKLKDTPIHPDSLSKIETGKRGLDVVELLVICDELGVNAADVIEGIVVIEVR